MLSARPNHLFILALFSTLFLTGCDDYPDQPGARNEKSASQPAMASSRPVLDVYKSPSCGCCGKWMEHLHTQGLDTVTHDARQLDTANARLVIPAQYRSCHTAVSSEGYVFEGHIPARYVKQFLSELPAGAAGLTVPGMPMGSPGMEQGDNFTPYQVLLLKRDGSTEIYARVNAATEQYE
ncbi:MAG: DUF411 domain-containing protein [Gammaproteobacteria bacterium]|nr:DUF411 domain-containing protein [Gammaproteobacteria bacterium]